MRGIDECMGSWTHQVLRALRGRPVHVARFSLSRVVRDDCDLDRGRVGKPVSVSTGGMGFKWRSDSRARFLPRGWVDVGRDCREPLAVRAARFEYRSKNPRVTVIGHTRETRYARSR